MDRHAVTSSNVASVGYENGTLEVEFKNGAVYDYSDVAPEEYQALLGSESVGKFVASRVRGRYPTAKVETDEAE